MNENEPWNIYENQQSRFTFNTISTCLGQSASPKPGQGGVVVMHEAPEPQIVQESESGPHVHDISGTLRAGKDNFQAVIHDEPFAAFDSTGGSQDMGNCDGHVAPTIKVGSSTGGSPPAIATSGTRTIVRRLTPLECERLMGWPDNYTAHGIDDNGQRVTIANTQRYRICGNGIVATVTEWIGKRLPN